MCKTTIGCRYGNERQNWRDSCMVLKNRCADLIDRSAISSTQ